MSSKFQWDKGNLKHVIQDHPKRSNTQDEVESLFDDPLIKIAPDIKHSITETRFNAVAFSNLNRVLFVVFTIRDSLIRPLSCRPASKEERDHYAQLSQK